MLAMLLGTGVAFELPVVLAVMGWLGIVTARSLWRFNKFALVLSAVVGGILTPGPDVLSQVLMAGPLFGLYNISILVVFIIERGRRKRLAELAKETGADLVPME
jgi:sec-independent protein translocase protein TatC